MCVLRSLANPSLFSLVQATRLVKNSILDIQNPDLEVDDMDYVMDPHPAEHHDEHDENDGDDDMAEADAAGGGAGVYPNTAS